MLTATLAYAVFGTSFVSTVKNGAMPVNLVNCSVLLWFTFFALRKQVDILTPRRHLEKKFQLSMQTWLTCEEKASRQEIDPRTRKGQFLDGIYDLIWNIPRKWEKE